MKYLSEIPHLQVWNPTKRKPLCTFKNGEYETDDELEISILDSVAGVTRADGSEPEGEEYVAPPEPEKVIAEMDLDEMSLKQLREYAKSNKITIPFGTRSTEGVRAFIKQEIEKE